jgi:hypothetical protein
MIVGMKVPCARDFFPNRKTLQNSANFYKVSARLGEGKAELRVMPFYPIANFGGFPYGAA